MFSERLKELRKEKNLTQSQLSKELNVSLGAIGNWETGNRTPDVNTLSFIANYFGVTVDYLVGKTEQKMPLVNNDEELTEYLYYLKTRPELRMLFKVSSKASKEDVEQAVRIIEAIRNDEKDEPPST